MPCYHPIPGWYARRKNDSGKRSIVFSPADGFSDMKIEVPCGRCLGCRLEKSRQWAVRCVHESKLWPVSVFATLTYQDDPGSLRPRDFVLFMKRLRIKHSGVRFFQCGEYGEALGRPHHHALLFNCWFEDRRFLKEKAGVELYTSKELDSTWGFGQCTLGTVTFESAAYVARYSMKKVFGPAAEAHYNGRVPEYCTMSRRPGIGAGHLERFRGDVFPADEVVVRGVACRPPRYYDVLLGNDSPSVLSRVKARRRRRMREEIARIGGELANSKKLLVREVVKAAAVSNLSREVEHGGQGVRDSGRKG